MHDDSAPKLTTWTLGAIKRRNMSLEGYCEANACRRFYVFDVDALIEGFGEHWLVPEILPVTCAACGGRLKFQLAMTAPESDASADDDIC